jgi:hypothetical protein
MTINSVNDRLQDAAEDDKYGGYIIGEVVENNDPDGVARIKVKVPNVLDSDQGPIPWCLPSKHSPFGQGNGYGVYGSPAVGSPVRIRFQDGDPNYPVYEADEYLKAHANPKFSNPKTWGFKDPGGSELFVNYETGAWEFTHQSGTTLKYDGDGDLNLHVAKDSTDDIVGNETTTVGGDSTKTVQGNQDTTVQGNSTANIQGNLTQSVQSAASLTADTITETAGSSISLNAPTITISGGALVTISGGSISLNAPSTSSSGILSAGNGATGVFTSKENKLVTVQDGIITSIV